MITGMHTNGHHNGHQNGHGSAGHEIVRASAPITTMTMPAPEQSPVAMIDDRMRGRWKYAIPLGLMLGLGFAAAGYKTAPVRFTSTGTIHVAPSGSPIMFQTPETGSVPRYEGVIATQAVLVRQPRVIDQALKDPKLAQTPLAKLPDAREFIMTDLAAGAARGSELISVSYEADSPAMAQTVVNAVLKAYDDIHGRDAGERRDHRLTVLHKNASDKRAEKNLKDQQIRDFLNSSKFGVRDLEQLIQAKILYMEQVSQNIERDMIELKLRKSLADKVAAEPQQGPTPAQLDAFDPSLVDLRSAVRQAETELENWKKRIINPNHTILLTAERRVSQTIDRLAEAEATARQKYIALGGQTGVDVGITARPIAQIEAEMKEFGEHLEKCQQELAAMQLESSQLLQMQMEYDKLKEDLEGIENQIEILNTEADAMFAGMIRIQEEGQLPVRPSKDRRKQMAALGFAGGIGVSLVLFFVLGTFDQRTYSANQLRRGKQQYRCLGVLPDLGLGKVERELSETAVQCIHQIRNRIEALRDPVPSYMLAVTSPYQGDGKTSLALALGWSYAAAGYRTLLMDCDLVGQGLSRQLGIGNRTGLREILRDRVLDSQIVKLPVPNLHGLGVGLDESIGPESIRRDDFCTLAAELRQNFDIIIADTGPFIGSIEVLPVASAADSVVFSIRRGRSRSRLDDCFTELANSNISSLGVILNCAVQSDCVRYVSQSVNSARHEVVAEVGKPSAKPERSENALVRAMESSGREHLRTHEVVK